MGKRISETAVIVPVTEEDRRASRRVKISRPMLARPSNPTFKEEVETTLNTFRTQAEHYVGMRVSVILEYAPTDRCNSTYFGDASSFSVMSCESRGVKIGV